MLALTLVVCLVREPVQCKQVGGFADQTSFSGCFVAGEQAAAEYVAEHPIWRLQRVRCSWGNRKEGTA